MNEQQVENPRCRLGVYSAIKAACHLVAAFSDSIGRHEHIRLTEGECHFRALDAAFASGRDVPYRPFCEQIYRFAYEPNDVDMDHRNRTSTAAVPSEA